MLYRSHTGVTKRGRSKSGFLHQHKNVAAVAQPAPVTPGISRRMVREHARRLFRDKWLQQPLTPSEWRLAEGDLVRVLEAEAL
jgi:hypothetical protein